MGHITISGSVQEVIIVRLMIIFIYNQELIMCTISTSYYLYYSIAISVILIENSYDGEVNVNRSIFILVVVEG